MRKKQNRVKKCCYFFSVSKFMWNYKNFDIFFYYLCKYRALKEMLGEEDDFVPSGPILIGDNDSLG